MLLLVMLVLVLPLSILVPLLLAPLLNPTDNVFATALSLGLLCTLLYKVSENIPGDVQALAQCHKWVVGTHEYLQTLRHTALIKMTSRLHMKLSRLMRKLGKLSTSWLLRHSQSVIILRTKPGGIFPMQCVCMSSWAQHGA